MEESEPPSSMRKPFTIHHSLVVHRHCLGNAFSQNGSYRFGAAFYDLFHCGPFRFRKFIQYETSRVANRMFRLYSNSQPNKFIRAQAADDRLQPVMSPGAATRA